jgi:hypothetical protein
MKLQKLGGYAAIASVCVSIIFSIMRGPAYLMDAEKAMAGLWEGAKAHELT